jgi:hypothetical protein
VPATHCSTPPRRTAHFRRTPSMVFSSHIAASALVRMSVTSEMTKLLVSFVSIDDRPTAHDIASHRAGTVITRSSSAPSTYQRTYAGIVRSLLVGSEDGLRSLRRRLRNARCRLLLRAEALFLQARERQAKTWQHVTTHSQQHYRDHRRRLTSQQHDDEALCVCANTHTHTHTHIHTHTHTREPLHSESTARHMGTHDDLHGWPQHGCMQGVAGGADVTLLHRCTALDDVTQLRLVSATVPAAN